LTLIEQKGFLKFELAFKEHFKNYIAGVRFFSLSFFPLHVNSSMKMQFIFESQAFYAGFRKGVGFPMAGMEKMAAIAHKHRIPVTWLTNAQGAEVTATRFTQYHEQYGDDVSLWLMPYARYKKDQYKTVMHWSVEDLRQFVGNELDRARTALPWAAWDTCGFFFRNSTVLQVLAELNFISVYGACWYQFITDSVDDVGIPYGCYYMDPQNFKRPYPTPVGDGGKKLLISNEWLTHDLNKVANYKHTASIYSTDPNDVNNNGVCYPGQTLYWHELFRQHYRNSQYNAFYPFILHQESHEMLHNDQFQLYSAEKVAETALIMEDLLDFVTHPNHHFDVEFTTIPAAMRKYRENFAITPSMISVFDDTDITAARYQQTRLAALDRVKWNLSKIARVRGSKHSRGLMGGPYPPTLVYYDSECQLYFHQPQCWPVEVRNYLRPEPLTTKNLTRNSDIFLEPRYPLPTWDMPTPNELKITIGKNPHPAVPFPYGIVIWHPDRLFNGQLYARWKDCIAHLPTLNTVKDLDAQTPLLKELFHLEGPISAARCCWYLDSPPAAIGGHNALLIKLHLESSPCTITLRAPEPSPSK
jgi:hypothetical protein